MVAFLKRLDWESFGVIVILALAGIGLVSVVRDPPRARIIVVPVKVIPAPDQGDAPVRNDI